MGRGLSRGQRCPPPLLHTHPTSPHPHRATRQVRQHSLQPTGTRAGGFFGARQGTQTQQLDLSRREDGLVGSRSPDLLLLLWEWAGVRSSSGFKGLVWRCEALLSAPPLTSLSPQTAASQSQSIPAISQAPQSGTMGYMGNQSVSMGYQPYSMQVSALCLAMGEQGLVGLQPMEPSWGRSRGGWGQPPLPCACCTYPSPSDTHPLVPIGSHVCPARPGHSFEQPASPAVLPARAAAPLPTGECHPPRGSGPSRARVLMKPHTNEAVSSAPGGPSCGAPPAAAPTSACPRAAAPGQRRGPAHLV